MASNGYVRRLCTGCMFYTSDREYGEMCILHDELWGFDGMRWVSANDYERDPEIAAKHDEPCEHYSDKREIRNQLREKFGIKKIDFEKE